MDSITCVAKGATKHMWLEVTLQPVLSTAELYMCSTLDASIDDVELNHYVWYPYMLRLVRCFVASAMLNIQCLQACFRSTMSAHSTTCASALARSSAAYARGTDQTYRVGKWTPKLKCFLHTLLSKDNLKGSV